MREILEKGLTETGLGTSCIPALEEFSRLLLEKNKVMNLTAITEPEKVARLHMLDCAALASHWDLAGKKLIDVGTGAGFPGLVLKIVVPSLRLTLLDSMKKRLDWLEELCGVLGLTDVTILHGRAEEQAGDPALRERFDFVTARAVASLSVLTELCLPYIRQGGLFLAMKSTDSGEELRSAGKAIKTLGGRLEETWDYEIPTASLSHRVAAIRKTGPTPPKYPRRFGQIKKQPL